MAVKKNKTTSNSSSGDMVLNVLTLVPKTLVSGLFKVLDFFVTLLINIISFFGVGILYIVLHLGRAIGFTFKIVFKYFFGYIFKGMGAVLTAIEKSVVEAHKKSVEKQRIAKEKRKAELEKKKEIKEAKKEAKKNKPGSFETMGNYFKKKINNTSIVKYYQRQKYKDLKELGIENIGQEKKLTQKAMYKYIAMDKEGRMTTGYFAAFSKLDVYSYLLDEGYKVYKIETNRAIQFFHGESSFLTTKMSTKDLIFWLTQLSTYIKSGIPLTDAVKLLAKQDKRKKYQKTYDALIYELTMGESFATALERQGNVFPALLINMIKASELIGDIEGTLDDMAAYYDDIETTRKEFKSAMTYPTIVMVFAIAIVTFILTYVVPKFVDVYESAGVKLNPITKFILELSAFLKNNYLFLILGVVGIILVIYMLYKYVKSFKTFTQYLLMKIPVVGNLIIYKEITLFSKTFAALQKSNVLLTDSIDILIKITNNELYKMIMRETIANLIKGNKMSDTFKDNWAIPEIAYYMILTGEQTGELANMLEKVAGFYSTQQKSMVKTLQSFIEPIMIAFLAVIVGGIIVAIIVPMFGLYSELM